MNSRKLLLATAFIGVALAGPVLAQSGGQGANQPATPSPTTPGTVQPMAPYGTGTTGVTPTGTATTGPAPAATMPRAGISDPMKIDAMSLRGGVRTSQVVGMSVVNNTGEMLGTIDDLIVMPGEAVPYAVLSVGAYMGVPAHYVVVPYSMLMSRDNKAMRLPDATKDSLKAMPSFRYPA